MHVLTSLDLNDAEESQDPAISGNNIAALKKKSASRFEWS